VWVRNPQTDAGPAGYLLRVSGTLPQTGLNPLAPAAGWMLLLLGAALLIQSWRCARTDNS